MGYCDDASLHEGGVVGAEIRFGFMTLEFGIVTEAVSLVTLGGGAFSYKADQNTAESG